MRRKHNPMVSLVALILLATILVWICAGCGNEIAPAEETDRFVVVTYNRVWPLDSIYIITDTETSVQYLVADGTKGIGVTQLLPAEVAGNG